MGTLIIFSLFIFIACSQKSKPDKPSPTKVISTEVPTTPGEETQDTDTATDTNQEMDENDENTDIDEVTDTDKETDDDSLSEADEIALIQLDDSANIFRDPNLTSDDYQDAISQIINIAADISLSKSVRNEAIQTIETLLNSDGLSAIGYAHLANGLGILASYPQTESLLRAESLQSLVTLLNDPSKLTVTEPSGIRLSYLATVTQTIGSIAANPITASLIGEEIIDALKMGIIGENFIFNDEVSMLNCLIGLAQASSIAQEIKDHITASINSIFDIKGFDYFGENIATILASIAGSPDTAGLITQSRIDELKNILLTAEQPISTYENMVAALGEIGLGSALDDSVKNSAWAALMDVLEAQTSINDIYLVIANGLYNLSQREDLSAEKQQELGDQLQEISTQIRDIFTDPNWSESYFSVISELIEYILLDPTLTDLITHDLVTELQTIIETTATNDEDDEQKCQGAAEALNKIAQNISVDTSLRTTAINGLYLIMKTSGFHPFAYSYATTAFNDFINSEQGVNWKNTFTLKEQDILASLVKSSKQISHPPLLIFEKIFNVPDFYNTVNSYFDTNFNKTDNDGLIYALAVSTYHTFERYGKESDLNDQSQIVQITDILLEILSSNLSKVWLHGPQAGAPSSYVLNILHPDNELFPADEQKELFKSFGVTDDSIVQITGTTDPTQTADKEVIMLNALRNLPGGRDLVVIFNLHGHPAVIEINHPDESAAGSFSPGTLYLDYVEVAQALYDAATRADNPIDLSRVTLITDACYSYDFSSNLLNTLYAILDAYGEEIKLPAMISTTERNVVSYAFHFTNSLNEAKGESNELNTSLLIEAMDELYQTHGRDLGVFFPVEPDKVEAIKNVLGITIDPPPVTNMLSPNIPAVGFMGKLFEGPDLNKQKMIFSDVELSLKGDNSFTLMHNKRPLYTKDGQIAQVRLADQTAIIKDFVLDPKKIAKAGIVNFNAYLKELGGKEVCLIEDNTHIRGFADKDNVLYITRSLANDKIALFHEMGEGYFSLHPRELPQGVTAHTYLRGCGSDLRIALSLAKEDIRDWDAETLITFLNNSANILKANGTRRTLNKSEEMLIRYNQTKGFKGRELLWGLQDILFSEEENIALTLNLLQQELSQRLQIKKETIKEIFKEFQLHPFISSFTDSKNSGQMATMILKEVEAITKRMKTLKIVQSDAAIDKQLKKIVQLYLVMKELSSLTSVAPDSKKVDISTNPKFQLKNSRSLILQAA
ncbi:hypothetical protein ACFLQ1_02285 [Candidatus Auribacterota bacterium]